MSAHKHTQGPWQAIGTMVRGRYALGENNRPGGLIADCGGYYTPETRANARLIAASVTYFNGVEEFIAYEAAVAAGDDVAAMQHYARASQLLRDALAKATGESA